MLSKFWKKFDEAFEALDEELDSHEFFDTSTSIQDSNGVTMINQSGKIEIKGEIKSLFVNGKKVDLK